MKTLQMLQNDTEQQDKFMDEDCKQWTKDKNNGW